MSWGVLHVGFQDPYGVEPEHSNVPPRLPKAGDSIWLLSHGRALRPVRKIIAVESGKIITKQEDGKTFFATEIGSWGEGWRFKGDSEAKPLTDLELQLIDIRTRRRIYSGEFIPQNYRKKATVPVCSVCKQWPCVKQEGCPDYESLAGGNNRSSMPRINKQEAA